MRWFYFKSQDNDTKYLKLLYTMGILIWNIYLEHLKYK